MGRLIDADALKAKAFGKRGGLIHTSDIDAMPTADAVPVVRCKDCKFYYRMTVETGICQLACPHFGNDGFCSEGERKDGEHDRG